MVGWLCGIAAAGNGPLWERTGLGVAKGDIFLHVAEDFETSFVLDNL